MSIKIKFIGLFVVLLFAGLAISSGISYKVTENTMVESALTTMDHDNLQVIQKVDLFHKKAQSDLLMAMEHPVFKDYFSLMETRSGNRYNQDGHIQFTQAQQKFKNVLDNWSLSLQKRFPIVETCLIDQTGQEHTRVTFGKIAPSEDFSNEESMAPFFLPTMALVTGQVHVQYPYMSPDAGKWVFSYTSPVILDDGSKPGLFHYELPVALFQSLIQKNRDPETGHTSASRFIILDPEGLIVADSDQTIPLEVKKNLILQKEDGKHRLKEYLPQINSISSSSRFVDIIERMVQGEIGSGWFDNQGGRYHITFRPLATFGWSIAHIRPTHALLKGETSLTGIRIAFTLIALGTLLLAVIILWFGVGKMIHPLQHLTNMVREIALGTLNLSSRVEVVGEDELGVLAKAFNHMFDTLEHNTESKVFTENVFGAMVDGLVVLDRENCIQRVNKAIIEILEESEEELLGRPLDQLILDHTFSALMFRDLLAKRFFRSQETVFETKDGRKVPVAISSSLLFEGEFTITGMVILAQDLRQRKQNEEQLHFLANFDVLTKLPNRTLLLERLSQALSRAPWRNQKVGVMHCILDRFREINDTLGLEAGNELLKETSVRLRAVVRDGDTVARVGVDEFILMLTDVAKAEDIVHVAEKVFQAVGLPLLLNGQEVFMTVSIGITVFPDNGSSAEELLKNADIATTYAKAQGKNQCRFFSDDLNEKGEQRLAMESDLRRAIERGELEPHYQPRWDLKEDRMVGAEALVRWRRGGGRPVSPGEFLPLAEELGLMESIDLWMLSQACQQARKWRDLGYPIIRISVNLSHQLFQRKDLVEVVNQTLDASNLKPESLELELTEAIIMGDSNHGLNTLKALRDMWVHLAIDDFGTGYSSFAYLRRLPVHVLKIDRSFVREITTNPEDAAIIKAIISMAHTLNLRTTAEGAEEQEQRDLLTQLGCDELQGYLISRPVPADELESKFLAKKPS